MVAEINATSIKDSMLIGSLDVSDVVEEQKEGTPIDPLDSVDKVEKIPERIEPRGGLSRSGSMTYTTHDESLSDSKRDEAEKLRLSRSATDVSFDKVVVREYPVDLGDNPSVSRGCPLTIGWDPVRHVEYKVEDYEVHKPPKRANNEMFLSFVDRHGILKEGGFSAKEVTEMAIKVNDERIRRFRTVIGVKK